jgi:hypothetical protein
MKYEFHPEAELELYEAAAYYEAGLSGLGRDFSDEVERVVNILLEHPELGAQVARICGTSFSDGFPSQSSTL